MVGEGHHRGAGTPHAEVDALARAGERARGGTAYVSLEPCNHTGRTGPCARALLDAGVTRVVHAQSDPGALTGGGADTLRAAGVEVVGGVLADEALALNRAWTFAIVHGRPMVTWKFAATLDGRSAAADGSSALDHRTARAGRRARPAGRVRRHPRRHRHRARRRPAPDRAPRRRHRCAGGSRCAWSWGCGRPPPTARVLDAAAPTLLLPTRDPAEALAALVEP